MRTPSRIPSVITAVVVAFIVAALGGAALGWIGWRHAAPLPSTAEVQAISFQVTGVPPDGVVRDDRLFSDPYVSTSLLDYLVGGDDYGSGYVHAVTTGPTTLDAARTALVGLGWRIGPHPSGGPGFSARQGSTVVAVVPSSSAVVAGAMIEDHHLSFEFERAAPASVRPLTIAGWLVGFTIGLLGTLWLVRIARRRKSGPAYQVIGWFGIASLLAGTVTTTGDLIDGWLLPDTLPPTAPWSDYLFYGVRLLTIIGLVLLAVSALAAVRPLRNSVVTARLVEPV